MPQAMLTGFMGNQSDTLIDWEIEYKGYQRPDEENPDLAEGYIEFHVIVEIVEALIEARDDKTYKKIKRPGYKLIVTQNVLFPDADAWETWHCYDEEFEKKDKGKAVDVFQRELLNIQEWIEIALSRARLIPQGKDVFECMLCGWVTDTMSDDIICEGCGKRFWSREK